MKRRILMVSAMILLLGSQAQMYAQHRGGPENKRPEMHEGRWPGKPMNGKAISHGEIVRLQDFYWKKYRIRLTHKEAERILIEEMRTKNKPGFAHTPPPPPPPKGHRPKPQGPQKPPRR